MKQIILTNLILGLLLFGCNQVETYSQTNISKEIIKSETENLITSNGPKAITRNIIQDRKGNIWIAAFDGIFRYDGKVFTNIISQVSSARFFSILEDRKGNLWFGSIGSGVYHYDGKSFKNLTIKDGLLNDEVTCIYEDKRGNIWFGVSGGASCYDGKAFRNYVINGNSMSEDWIKRVFPDRQPFEVNSIIEDKTGRLWFATRGNTFVYDGKTFAVFSHDSKPFNNVRTLIEDKRGNIWLSGSDGLWRYGGSTFTNFTQRFTGYIIEDKKGNFWTSSEKDRNLWTLSKYDGETLSNKEPTVIEIVNKPMTFGILEANDGSIWLGSTDGVHRYDRKTIMDF